MYVETFTVVEDRNTSPGGWTPLSGVSSHSYPRMLGKLTVWPGVSEAIAVLRQNLNAENSEETVNVSFLGPITVKSWPLTAVSGRPPYAGVLNLGSRHVPVHAAVGSILAFV